MYVATGFAWLWRKQWLWGFILLIEASIVIAAQLYMTLVPVGIGQPMIRLPQNQRVWWGLSTAIVLLLGMLMLSIRQRRNDRNTNLITPAPHPKTSFFKSQYFALILLPIVASASLYAFSYFSMPIRERERNPDRRGIRLAQGFTYAIYAQGTIDNPTVMTFAPNGKLYIGDIAGDLWVANDQDGDYRVDKISKFAGGFELLLGLLWYDDELFVASAGKIEALRDTDHDDIADERRLVAEGLPSLIYNPHSNNSLALGPDGRLYFGVGRTIAYGREPTAYGGSILSVSPDGGDVRILARGFGNPFDVAFNVRGDLFTGDNAGILPNGESPPDKLHYVVPGGDYDGDNDPFAPNKRPAVVNLEPHAVPTGLVFYNGKAYPAEYFDNAFLALWNRGEIMRFQLTPPSGSGMLNSNYRARDSVFGDGFLYPIDIVVGPDDNLYIADFGTSVIYRITYVGNVGNK